MIAFVDTSVLVKKYVEEKGSEKFATLLERVTEIVVAPTYWIELMSAVRRKSHAHGLAPKQVTWLVNEAKKDLLYFHSVKWEENLVEEASRLIQKYALTTLDSIQLASALLAKPDLFISADKGLCESAKKELREVALI